MSFGDRLGIVGVILAFVAIAAPYLWPDKKWIGWLSLSCAVVMLLAWGWSEVGSSLPRFRETHPIASTAIVFIVGGCLLSSLWLLLTQPKQSDVSSPDKVEKPVEPHKDVPTASQVTFSPANIEFVNGLSTIRSSRKLSFRFYFKNNGPVVANDVRVINTSSLIAVTPPPAVEQQMVASMRAAADTQRDQSHMLGPTVHVDAFTNLTTEVGPLTSDHAKGLINGTGRFYEYFWIGWTDSEGNKGEQEMCMYLRKPKSKQLTVDDVKTWDPVFLPPKQPK